MNPTEPEERDGNDGEDLGLTAQDIVEMLERACVDTLPHDAQEAVIRSAAEFVSRTILALARCDRLQFVYDPTRTTWQAVHTLLVHAKETGKDGPVAEYLVGAKLQTRYPESSIRNTSYSTSDEQTGEPGDFRVGDTVFHVTISPTPGHYEKCRRNIERGLRVYLLVPQDLMVGAKQNADVTAPGQMSVQSIESFVAQNIDELAGFSEVALERQLRELLDTYNRRVNEVEIDKSMLIEIPSNLFRDTQALQL